jgi:hypothetical protein
MGDEEPTYEEMNQRLYEQKSKRILEKGGAHAVTSTFRSVDQEAFQKALEANPKMTWLEFLAMLSPKKKK